MKAKKVLVLLMLNGFLLVLLLAVTEAALHVVRKDAQWLPDVLLGTARQLYWKEMKLIQFSRDCAQFDEALFYTLRPGRCRFEGPEFSNQYEINRIGLRDDDASLSAPQVIVLGDSHAMGWGVEQSQTFAQLIEERTRLRVLNAGVSSYGTAREIGMLKRLDTSQMKLLVIQYCENDIWENRAFQRAGNRLEISTRQAYEDAIAVRGAVRYRFGQDLVRLVRPHIAMIEARFRKASAEPPVSDAVPAPARRDSAALFRNILENAELSFDGVQVIAFEISNHGDVSPFVQFMQTESEAELSGPKIRVIDMTARLGPTNYYRLDGHLNASGHKVVADVIAEEFVEHSSE